MREKGVVFLLAVICLVLLPAAARAIDLDISVIKITGGDVVDLILVRHRITMEIQQKQVREAEVLAGDINAYVKAAFGHFQAFKSLSDRATKEGGFADAALLRGRFDELAKGSYLFKTQLALHGVVHSENPKFAELLRIAEEADGTVIEAVLAMSYRVKMDDERLTLVKGADFFEDLSSKPHMNMDTILEYLLQNERAKRLTIPPEVKAEMVALMKSMAAVVDQRLFDKYHYRKDKLGITSDEAKVVLGDHSLLNAQDAKLRIITFMVDFLRAKFQVPSGYPHAIYVWNAGADDSAHNSDVDDGFHGDPGELRSDASAFDTDDDHWRINFKVSKKVVHAGWEDGSRTLEQCARCVQIEESRKSGIKSVFFRKARSEAQIEAAKAVSAVCKLEKQRAQGDLDGLRAQLAKDYPDASTLLRTLMRSPTPVATAEAEGFRRAMRVIVAKQLYDEQLRQRGAPGKAEIKGTVEPNADDVGYEDVSNSE